MIIMNIHLITIGDKMPAWVRQVMTNMPVPTTRMP